MRLIRVCESEDFTVDYDKDRGMYRVGILENCHCKESYWFDAYEEREIKDLYLVYGTINEHGDADTWVEYIFDNEEQALSCAEWLNATKKQKNVYYYKSNGAWYLNKLDYVEELKKLEDKA